MLFFGLTIPISAAIADRIGGRTMLIIATLGIIAFGFTFAPLFGAHSTAAVCVFLALGFSLTGLTYGPLASALASLFPTAVRYTGSSLTFNLAGVLGASLAPYVASLLAESIRRELRRFLSIDGRRRSRSFALLVLGRLSPHHGVEPAREAA